MSGLFRDVFSGLAQLFEAAAEALAGHEDEGDENPYRHRASRVFAPRPGQYGVGLSAIPDAFTPETRDAAGEAWLSASSWAFSADGEIKPDRAGIEARLASADAFVHVQDLPETDLLLAADYAGPSLGMLFKIDRLWRISRQRECARSAAMGNRHGPGDGSVSLFDMGMAARHLCGLGHAAA